MARALVAHENFKEDFTAFTAELLEENDKSKYEWIDNPKSGNLEAVLPCAEQAKARCQEHKGESKVRQLLVSLSERIHDYSGVVDVFGSHHPEYTALVWSAMKVLFVVKASFMA